MIPRLLSLSPSIRIAPERLMGMLLWGIVCGAGLGVVWDIFRITRVLAGVRYPSRRADVLYQKPLPLLRRPVSRPSADAGGRPWRILRHTVIFLEDVLFGLLCGVVMTLLIYFTNDGIFRAMAPMGMLTGFFVYYMTVGRLVLSLSQGIVFALRAALCYAFALLLLPPRVALWIWRHTVGAFLRRRIEEIRHRRAERYHTEMLRELTRRAESGWLTETAMKKKGGRHRAKKKRSKKNDDRVAECPDLSDADRGLCHHLFCDQADGE